MKESFARFTEKETRALDKKSRDSLTIVLDILKVAEPGARKTKIIQSASLSFELTSKYLPLVSELGFVKCKNRYWQLTDRGKDFLDQCTKLEEFYSEIRILFKTLRTEREQILQNCYLNQIVPISQIIRKEAN